MKANTTAHSIVFMVMLSVGVWSTSAQTVVTYPSPGAAYESKKYIVTVQGTNNVPVFRGHNPDSDAQYGGTYPGEFAYFSFSGTVQVQVTFGSTITSAVVRPTNLGIKPTFSGTSATFPLSHPANMTVEINGNVLTPLFLFANPLETNVPSATDPNVIYFGPGVHSPSGGNVDVAAGQTVYIAGGAVVHSRISVKGDGVTLRGRGVLDTVLLSQRQQKISMWGNKNFRAEGIIINHAQWWTFNIFACDGVNVQNVKIVNPQCVNDGYDINGSRNVTIDGCFTRTDDDGVTIKAAQYSNTTGNCGNITVRNCVFWNSDYGHAMIVGNELDCDSVTGIAFVNNDVLHLGDGAALAVQPYGKAYVKGVLFDSIRVENASTRVFAIGIKPGAASGDGNVDSVTIRNVSVNQAAVPAASIMGTSAATRVRNIAFENLTYNGTAVTNLTDAKISLVQFVRNVTFKDNPDAYCSGDGWLVLASVNGQDAYNAIDGNTATRWTVGAPKSPGQWFAVNMRWKAGFDKIVLDNTLSPGGEPIGYNVYVSDDGATWGTAIATGAGATNGMTTISFPAVTKQYFKIEQTGGNGSGGWWSIHEISIFSGTTQIRPNTDAVLCGPYVPATGLSITPATATINENQNQQLVSVVAPANASLKAVVWSSSNPAIATVDAFGLVYPNKAGTVTITAKSVDNSAITAMSTISINQVPQKPYGGVAWAIPGTIEAENFDSGGERVAYHDVDPQNQGGQYRPNEGVDIQALTGGGYTVGWITTGEWLEYTVNVATAGSYTFAARVSTTAAWGQKFHIEIDNVDKTGAIAIPNTANWLVYADAISTGVALTAGTHIMRVYADFGGYNLDKVVVTSSSAAVGDRSMTCAAEGFHIGDGGRIRYALARPARVSLCLFDLTGARVFDFASGHEAAGRHEIVLSPESISPGRYIVEFVVDGRAIRRSLVVTH